MKFISKRQSGFTVLEILIVMTLLTIIGSLVLIINLDDYRGYQFRDERDLLVSALYRARSEAISNVCIGSSCSDGQVHGVHVQNGQYIIFQGSSYNSTDTKNQAVSGNGPVTVALPNGADVVFAQLSGQATPNVWSATVQDAFGHSATVSVNSEGRISW